MPNRSLKTMLDLKPGDHACCLYETEEEHRTVVRSFLLGGLQQGEKVVYIMDGHASDVISGYLTDDGVDVEVCRSSGQLVFLHWKDAYLRDGVFDPERVIQLLRDGGEQIFVGGYAALRVSGEMTWTLLGEAGLLRVLTAIAETAEQFAVPNLFPRVTENIARRDIVGLAGQHITIGFNAHRILGRIAAVYAQAHLHG